MTPRKRKALTDVQRARRLETQRARYAANPEAGRAHSRAVRLANPEKARVSTKAWFRAHLDQVRITRGVWRSANRDKIRATLAAWREANPEKNRIACHVRRARKRAAAYDPDAGLPEVIALWGANCYICGVPTDPVAPVRTRYKAELEHVKPLSRGGTHTLDNLRCACYPCNRVKGARLTAEQVAEMFT